MISPCIVLYSLFLYDLVPTAAGEQYIMVMIINLPSFFVLDRLVTMAKQAANAID
jgi:hypothetical protein